jgi:hypothetical protein
MVANPHLSPMASCMAFSHNEEFFWLKVGIAQINIEYICWSKRI